MDRRTYNREWMRAWRDKHRIIVVKYKRVLVAAPGRCSKCFIILNKQPNHNCDSTGIEYQEFGATENAIQSTELPTLQ